MLQTTLIMKVTETGAFTEDGKSIQVPDGEDWDVLGISFTVVPADINISYFALIGFNLPGAGGIYETASVRVISQVANDPNDPIAFCGAPGGADKEIAIGSEQRHATVRLPNRILLPELSTIFARVVSTPATSGEVKNLRVLVDKYTHLNIP